MLLKIIASIKSFFGIGVSRNVMLDQLYTLQAELLTANIEVRKLRVENRRLVKEYASLEDDAASAWEMLEEIKKAENFLAGNPRAIEETLENIEEQMLVEILQKTKPYGEA